MCLYEFVLLRRTHVAASSIRAISAAVLGLLIPGTGAGSGKFTVACADDVTEAPVGSKAIHVPVLAVLLFITALTILCGNSPQG